MKVTITNISGTGQYWAGAALSFDIGEVKVVKRSYADLDRDEGLKKQIVEKKFSVDLEPEASDLPFGSPIPVRVTNATRPAVSEVAKGGKVWNLDDGFPNYSDGARWVRADGIPV